MLRYQFNVDPHALSDDQWAELYGQFVYAKKEDYKAMSSYMKNALSEAISEFFIPVLNKLYGPKK